MSKAGLLAARLFGSKLPVFRDIAEAERVLYRQRDELLRTLTDVSRRSSEFRPDFRPESLKNLEHWYFELSEGAGFGSIGINKETFERTMAMYLGEVLVRNAPSFEWFVAEFAFEQGRFEIGVKRPLHQVMLSRLTPAPHERNKREQCLWRTYRRHSGQ
jgi:hypothetical protein